MRLVVIASNNLWLRLLLHGRITIEQFLVLIQFIVGRRARSIHKTARWFWVAVCGRVRGACATHLFQAYCRFIRGWLLLSDTGCPRCCRLHCLSIEIIVAGRRAQGCVWSKHVWVVQVGRGVLWLASFVHSLESVWKRLKG